MYPFYPRPKRWGYMYPVPRVPRGGGAYAQGHSYPFRNIAKRMIYKNKFHFIGLITRRAVEVLFEILDPFWKRIRTSK